jgi:hypothetical protein
MTSDRPPPRHPAEIWHRLQEIAEEEDPAFSKKSVVEHSQSGAEGLKDVERWLQIYQRRIDPEHRYQFPAHHPRYRGCCLMARNWPTGLSWEAFDETTLKRLPIPGQPDRESLLRAIDRLLGG